MKRCMRDLKTWDRNSLAPMHRAGSLHPRRRLWLHALMQVVVLEANRQLELLRGDMERVRRNHSSLREEMQVSCFQLIWYTCHMFASHGLCSFLFVLCCHIILFTDTNGLWVLHGSMIYCLEAYMCPDPILGRKFWQRQGD